jgi:hypothetical protein
LQAAVAVLSVRNRVSHRDVVECCEQLFGARVSSGTVDAILTRVADALKGPDADLLERVRAVKALNMEETGWRTAGERRALVGRLHRPSCHAARPLRPPRGPRQGAAADTSPIVTSEVALPQDHHPGALLLRAMHRGRADADAERRCENGSGDRTVLVCS